MSLTSALINHHIPSPRTHARTAVYLSQTSHPLARTHGATRLPRATPHPHPSTQPGVCGGLQGSQPLRTAPRGDSTRRGRPMSILGILLMCLGYEQGVDYTLVALFALEPDLFSTRQRHSWPSIHTSPLLPTVYSHATVIPNRLLVAARVASEKRCRSRSKIIIVCSSSCRVQGLEECGQTRNFCQRNRILPFIHWRPHVAGPRLDALLLGNKEG